MAIYECRENNENHISVSEGTRRAVLFGTAKTVNGICDAVSVIRGKAALAFDGWYGVDWDDITADIEAELGRRGLSVSFRSSAELYIGKPDMEAYKGRFITDDPAFGWENLEGCLDDIIDQERISDLADILRDKSFDEDMLVVYGPGSAAAGINGYYDLIFYFDKLVQYMLLKMWDSELVPFGYDQPDPSYGWKEYYYCDYHLLLKQKLFLADELDYYVDALDTDDLKLVPRTAFDEIVGELARQPVKCIETYQGGPWGAYRFKQLENIEGLECNAWHTTASPDLSMEVDFGGERMLNLPFILLMQYPEQLVGRHVADKYPLLFPFQVGIDDGWFPEPTPRERTAMPMHNHPGIDYCKRHFNEIYGRYETYYIVEAYEGAGSFMGYRDGCDLEEWEKKCRESDNGTLIPDWKEYVKLWETVPGDLFLIPPGTVHGHGGNQMVLEMDTCPAVAGNEYSFFLHDFARNTWNDDEKAMTGRPMRMHLDHGFDNERWRRESWVRDNLRARPKVVLDKDEYTVERFSTLPEMPFHIERIRYYDRAEYSTEGKFTHVATLTVGKKAMIRSLDDPSRKAEIVRYHCAVIPASFGDYEIVSMDGGFNTVVLIRLKDG